MKCPYCGRMLHIRPVDDPVRQYCYECPDCGYRKPNTGIESISLNELCDEIYQDAVAHGLWEENEKWPVTCATRISDEVDELMDAGADWEDEGFDLDDPDQAYSEELADVVIMCMSVAGALGIDIDAAIRRKMETNKKRPWKHEGEKK